MLTQIKSIYFIARYICYLPLIFLMMINLSCFQDPISIDLSQFGQNIVIEGYITDYEGVNAVRISQTAPISTENIFPAVSDALVTITDDQNKSVQLIETEPGLYQNSTLKGVYGRSYTLSVSYEGKTYRASSVMPQPLYFFSIYFQQIDPSVDRYELLCYLKDREGIKDYCMIDLYINGTLVAHSLYQDDKSDGEEIIFDDFDIVFNPGDHVIIDLLTIDKFTYEFFYTLDQISDSDQEDFEDTIMPVTTYNPTSNWDNSAFGYFSAHSVRRYNRIVE